MIDRRRGRRRHEARRTAVVKVRPRPGIVEGGVNIEPLVGIAVVIMKEDLALFSEGYQAVHERGV